MKDAKKVKNAQSGKLPSYYSILPARVRYCSDLSFLEIVLYSEITALTNALGYCYATNKYFSKLYSRDTRTITRSISNLEECGFIKSVIDKSGGNVRKIYLTHAIDETVYTPIDKNVVPPIDKNVDRNITSSNTTSLSKTRARENEEISRIDMPSDDENIMELFKKVYKRRKS